MRSEAYLNNQVKHTCAAPRYRGGMSKTKKKRGQDWIRDETKLAGRLTNRMEEKGLKPVDLAGWCSVSVSAVGQWLHGSSSNLKLENLFTLADKLGLEPRWLAIGKGPKQKSDAVPIAALRESLQPAIFEAVMRQAVPEYKVEPTATPSDETSTAPSKAIRVDVSERTDSARSGRKDKAARN